MFSVLIPVYNHRAYLVDGVLSALRSSLVTEILVVDDGSRDGSSDLFPLLEQISPKVRILTGPSQNLGAHVRLNQLAAEARCKWLAVLNSDDLYGAGRFESIERYAVRGDADLFFGNLVLIDDCGRRMGSRDAIRHNEVPWPEEWPIESMVRRHDWLPLLALQNVIGTSTNMVFTRSLFEKLGGFQAYRYCHDWDFALRASLQGRIMHSPSMLSLYRVHRGNTIKEAASGIRSEVRRMLGRVLATETREDKRTKLRNLFHCSHYMTRPEPPVITIVIPDELSRELLHNEVRSASLPVAVVPSWNSVSRDTAYVFNTSPEAAAPLRLNDVRGLLLSVAVRGYDAILLSRSAATDPASDVGRPIEGVLLNTESIGRWTEGAVRMIQLYPADRQQLTPLAEQLKCSCLDKASQDQTLSRAGKAVQVVFPDATLDQDKRPVVFVLPAFLAIGGVERLVVDTMRHLSYAFRFVIVTTEPLRPEQGSMHNEAMELAPVYDLAELVRVEDRIDAMIVLRDWYNPAVIWICNGSPWQTEHADDIRQVFYDAAIVDHQAYDHEAGWISQFDNGGIKLSNRFVAINQKIYKVFQERFGIGAEKIDLIYHGTDMTRLKRRDVTDEEIAERRRGFNLKPHLPTFGMVGRLTRQKRPLDLITLARRIGPDSQFVWVGLGELEEEFLSEISQIDNIQLVGHQTDLRQIYEMLDGLIITSEFEGLPIVLLEAMAMGLPALSTDVGAIAEVLERYGSGLVYSPPGDVNALEEAFKVFRKDFSKFKNRALQNMSLVATQFSVERMTDQYADCFRRAIEETHLKLRSKTCEAKLIPTEEARVQQNIRADLNTELRVARDASFRSCESREKKPVHKRTLQTSTLKAKSRKDKVGER